MWLAFRDDSITPVPAIAKQQQRRWRWRRRRRAGRSPLSFPAEHIFVLALILARPAPPTARARHSCPFAFVGTRVTWELLASVCFLAPFCFLSTLVFISPSASFYSRNSLGVRHRCRRETWCSRFTVHDCACERTCDVPA